MDSESRAQKITSARQLLKKFQQKKTVEPSSAPQPAQYTPLVEPPVQTGTGSQTAETTTAHQAALAVPSASEQDAAHLEPPAATPPLPMFTFPGDAGTSFSECLGASTGAAAAFTAGVTSVTAAQPAVLAAESSAPPVGGVADPRLEAPPDPPLPASVTGLCAGVTCSDSDSPVAVLSKDSPVVLGESVVVGESDSPVVLGESDSPVVVGESAVAGEPAAASPGDPVQVGDTGSMTSSFTFASQGGTGSHSGSHSATSSRTSDWEYVGGPQEAAKPQVAAAEEAAPSHLTSETLRQLSDRLSQMTADGDAGDGGAASAVALGLEHRNAELAAQLETERSLRAVAEQQTEALRGRVSELEASGEAAVRGAEQRLQERQAALAEQGRAQAQTIGILVAEKTELRAEADRLHTQLQQKTDEFEQTGARLAAAEASASQLQAQISRADETQVSVQHLQSLYAEADNERNRNRELCQELREELDEARQRLRTQLDANQQLTRQLADVSGRLELAEIRVTQLSGSTDGQSEPAQSASVAADAARLQAERAAEQARAERDAAAVQFQQYSAALAARLAEAEKQRDALVQQQAVVAAQQAAVPAPVEVTPTPAPPARDAEREELNALRDQRQKDAAELEALTQQLRALGEENARLSLSGQQMAATLRDMEVTVERANSSAVNQDQLAREMESDRVAASRAMAQNKQLKRQLEELQDGFITLSNKKLELTETLEQERRSAEQGEQQRLLLQAELERAAAQAIDAEQRHMTAQQMVDHLRHYEAVGRQAETLQTELAAAQEQLSRLQAAPSEPVPQQTAAAVGTAPPSGAEDHPEAPRPGPGERSEAPPPGPGEHAAAPVGSSGAAEEATPSESAESRASSPSGRARPPVEEVIREREELRARLQQFIGGGAVDPAEHERLRSALAQLEVRFCDVMNQVAVLREERQGLEHLCEQLQGETDTIGEYISLYQVQRSALKQQAAERQQELATLHEDRQQLRHQLQQLQQLVSQLMSSRPATPASQPPDAAGSESEAVEEPVRVATVAPSGEPAAAVTGSETPPTPADFSGDSAPAREATARRIMTLIEQIGANEYVDGHAAPLHVCQHCRGKRVLNV